MEQTPNSLEEVYWRYHDNRCLNTFLSESYMWMFQYAHRRLNRDPDVCQDFLLQFFEKVPRFLHSYSASRRTRFTGYLARCMRFDFLNYIRARKRYQPVQCDYPVEHMARRETSPDTDWHTLLRRALACIRPSRRIPLKLQCGWPLNLEDLRFLTRRYGLQRTQSLWQDYQKKIAGEAERARRHKHQMSLYFDRLHRGFDSRNYRDIRRRKERNQAFSCRTVLSLREIGNHLGTSKAGLHRHLAIGRTELKELIGGESVPKNEPPDILEAGLLSDERHALLYQFTSFHDRLYLVMEGVKNLEPPGISLYSQGKLCYRLGLSEAIALPLHLMPAGRYALEGVGHKLGFSISV